MKLCFLRFFLTSVIIFTSGIPLTAQYTLNKEKTQIELLLKQSKTKFTVSEILGWKKGRPLPESEIYNLDINMDTVGFWTKSAHEDIWKINIGVPNAKGFFISFTDFYLPEGSRLYAYSSDDPKDAIVFQNEDNPDGGAYSLENLKGDNVVLEYVRPSGIKETPRLHFFNVGYKYVDDRGDQLTGFNASGNYCMINVNCPEGEAWKAQKRGVVHLRMLKSDKKTYLCSGTLINNTKNDKTPYILTADHCFENMTKEEIEQQTEFFFEYESPVCEENILPTYKYHKGSQVMVLNPIRDGSDGALLKLTGSIPDNWDVYFNGWDRTNDANSIQGGGIIHHPQGDVKKLTLYNKSPESGRWNDEAPNGTHWIVKYSQGATRGGSSGSPMFNSSGLVVGTLTGGDSDCGKPNYSDQYGKFWYHWNQYRDANMHMSKYLDPINENPKVLTGLYNNENAIRELLLERYDLNVMPNETSSIRIFNGNGGYSVESSDHSIVSTNLSGNTINIITHKIGTATIKVTDRKNKEKEINISVHKHIDFAMDEDKTLKINVYKDEDVIKQVMVIDLDGNTLYNENNLDKKTFDLNMQAFRKGLYIIQVKTKNGTSRTEKFIW